MAKEDYTPIIGLEKTKVAKWIEDKIRGAIKEVLEGIMEAEAEELFCAKLVSLKRMATDDPDTITKITDR